ncbi:MAG: nucleotidyltransferase domain-containing protein [Methanobacteriota archaeon]|nr:MAG: nucleotidyltransferase domain-containing protein [Euryarchaeota archaeon]
MMLKMLEGKTAMMDKLEKDIQRVVGKHKSIVAIYLFGSVNKKKAEGELGDIDVAVLLEPYEEDTAISVALSFPKKYDVVILNTARPNIVVEIMRNGTLIYKKAGFRKAQAKVSSYVRMYEKLLVKAGVL